MRTSLKLPFGFSSIVTQIMQTDLSPDQIPESVRQGKNCSSMIVILILFFRWEKHYERTIHTSKYIQKKLTPSPNPPQGGSTASTQL